MPARKRGVVSAQRFHTAVSNDAFPERGASSRQLPHFSTTLKVAKSQQHDFPFGVGLSSAAVDHFIWIGFPPISGHPSKVVGGGGGS